MNKIKDGKTACWSWYTTRAAPTWVFRSLTFYHMLWLIVYFILGFLFWQGQREGSPDPEYLVSLRDLPHRRRKKARGKENKADNMSEPLHPPPITAISISILLIGVKIVEPKVVVARSGLPAITQGQGQIQAGGSFYKNLERLRCHLCIHSTSRRDCSE